MAKIPIMRPKLPSAERIAPYLRTIDSSRVYSNFGPLAASFEQRLAARFGVPDGSITTVVNATLGLTLALIAQGALPGTLCAMPAWTFIASAHAARMAGLVPYFIDVDRETWALDPGSVAAAIAEAPAPVGAVMPVVPFGRPIDGTAWDRFRGRNGLPVVIDAAAGFDLLAPSAVPAVVSLHATKILGVGEGGFVMSTDPSIVREIRTRSNFGFHGSREASVAAANAKFSEYQAAVGLAALDEWNEVRDEWMTVARAYRGGLAESNRMQFQDGFGKTWITSTCVLSLADSGADRLEAALERSGIETRRWWGSGAHRHGATMNCPRRALPATEALARSTVALPFYRDIAPGDVERVVSCVLEATAA